MNKTILALLLATASALNGQAQNQGTKHDTQQPVQTAETLRTEADGTVVINTGSLANDVYGFKGRVPLEIHIKKGKITEVQALKNQETPKYMAMAKSLLAAWNGLTPAQAAETKPDVVTGATFTSEAIIRNVQRGAAYARENLNAKGKAKKTPKGKR